MRMLAALVMLVSIIGGCSTDVEPSSEFEATTSTGASRRVHPADEPCENERADEAGQPVPADDVYVDAEVLDWPRADSAQEGFDAAEVESAVHNVGLSSTVLSFLVARRGQLVVEEYFNGATASDAHNIFSTTKLLTQLAIGAAVDDEYVVTLDTTLGQWVEETAGSPAAPITLEQLLLGRSGLAGEVNEPFSVETIIDAPLVAQPGTEYAYVTDNSELLALGLDRRVPGGLCRWLHQRVLGPLGVSVDHWHETPYGNVTGGSYAFLTPRELARLGQLLLDDGRAAGEQLLSAERIRSMTEQLTDFECLRGIAASSTRLLPSAHGMGVGSQQVGGYEVWEAGGFGGQTIMMVPDLELVVVITQEVGPVFERRLANLDVLEYAVLPMLTDAAAGTQARCPVSSLVRRDADGVETALPVPTGGFTDWSPDGSQIVFGSGHHLNDELYVIDADGTDARRLTDDGAVDFLARWSPDGTRIAFESDRGAPVRLPRAEFDLWLLDPATGETQLLTEGFGDVLGHSWSPNGDRIVFTRTPTTASVVGDLWLVDVRTGDAELLIDGDYAWPEWSPDGDAIAYVTTRDGRPFAAYLDLASGDHIDIAPGDFPRWSSDGRSILLTRDGSIIAVALDDGTEEVLTHGCCASIAPASGRLVISRES